MPEYLIALVASVVVGYGAFLHRKVDDTSQGLDEFKTEVAKTYVTKEDLEKNFDRLNNTLQRFEVKLDAHVFAEVKNLRDASLGRDYHD